MKNILAENMLRFRSKNIAAQEAAAIRKLIEQETPDTDIRLYSNLGERLNTLNLKDGVHELEDELANVNIFTAPGSNQDEKTISSKMVAFSGAYARPLYVSKNKTMFFIGKPMTGGPLDKNQRWVVGPSYEIAEPIINPESGSVRPGYRKELLKTNSAAAAYMQIYNFNTQGYRNNAQITKLVQILDSKGIIPKLKNEIDEQAYNLFTQNRHDAAIRIIKNA
jgi:hypothetical protein